MIAPMKCIPIKLIIIFMLYALPGLSRTTITLRNGKELKGTIVSENAQFVILNSQGSQVRILKSIISEVNGTSFSKNTPLLKTPSDQKNTTDQNLPEKKVSDTPKQQPATITKPPTPATPFSYTIYPGDSLTIELRNGSAFTGTVITENANFVKFEINGTTVNILKRIILRITRNGKELGSRASSKEQNEAPSSQRPVKIAMNQSAPPKTPEKAVKESSGNGQPSKLPKSQISKRQSVNQQTDTSPRSKPSPKKGVQSTKNAEQNTTRKSPSVSESETKEDNYGPKAPLDAKKTNQKNTDLSKDWEDSEDSENVAYKSGSSGSSGSSGEETNVETSPIETVTTAVSTDIAATINKLYLKVPHEQIRACQQLEAKGSEAVGAIPNLIDLFSYNTPYEPSWRERRKFNTEDISGISPAQAAIITLVSFGEPAIPALIKTLSHKNYVFRANAAIALGELRAMKAVPELITAIQDSHPRVRMEAAEALGKIRDPKTIPILVTQMNQDTLPEVLQVTENALKNLTDIPTLIAGLRAPYPVVQENCAYILWLMTTKEFKNDAQAWEDWWKEEQQKVN